MIDPRQRQPPPKRGNPSDDQAMAKTTQETTVVFPWKQVIKQTLVISAVTTVTGLIVGELFRRGLDTLKARRAAKKKEQSEAEELEGELATANPFGGAPPEAPGPRQNGLFYLPTPNNANMPGTYMPHAGFAQPQSAATPTGTTGFSPPILTPLGNNPNDRVDHLDRRLARLESLLAAQAQGQGRQHEG